MHHIIKNTLRGCFLAAALWLFSGLPTTASHLMGGEVKYTYLGPLGTGTNKYRYQISYYLYVNCDPSTSQIPDGRPVACVDLYNKTNNQYITTASFNRGASVILPSLVSPSCNIPGLQNVCVRYITYEGTVDLPFSAAGYYALTDDATRNNSIMNIQSPGGVGQSIYTEMAPFNLNNSSPQFLQQALAVICLGDTVSFSNGAFDAEGDQLVYTLTQPLSDISGTQGQNCQPGPPTWTLPGSVPYNPGYSYLQPFGSGSYVSINSTNGDTKFFIPNSGQGDYVIALQVQEYRTTSLGSTLIGTTRRELQILARPCPANPAPVVTTQIPGGGSVINVVAGNPVNFNVQFKDTTSQTVTPSTTLSGNFTGLPNQPVFSTTSGSGTFTRSFSWTPTCAQAGNYSVIITGTDNGCPAQPSQKTVTINVSPFRGVSISGINGPNNVCPTVTSGTYTVPSRVGTNPVVWSVTGGTIASGQNTGTVTINWTPGSTVRTITAVETSNKGCTDSATLQVSVVNPLNPVLSAASDTICAGGSTVISGPGISSGTFTYTVTPTGVTLGANTVNPVFTAPANLTAITTYTILVNAVDTAQQSCVSVSQPIQITVIPNNIAKAGSDLSGCSGGTIASLGSTLNPASGFTYLWSGTSAFPGFPNTDPHPVNITLPVNAGTTPVTYTLTLTATSKSGNCISTDQVVVTVNPLPPVTLTAAATSCSGSTYQLTAAGASIYTWTVSPTLPGTITGATPTVTFPTVTVPTTYTFTVTGTLNTTGCVKSAQTTVTVNPLPIVTAGSDQAHCVGQAATFTAGGAATYNWTVTPSLPGFPQTGASISVNPVAPGTYTLTATGTAATGCVNTDQVVLTVNPLPVITGTDRTICLGQTVTLTGSGAGIGGTYTWNTPGNPSGATISFTPTAAGTFTYTLTGTNSNGCVNTDAQVTVTVNPLPVITAVVAAPSICSESSTQLTASGAGTGGSYSWTQVSGPTGTIASPSLATTAVSFTNVLTTQTAVFQVTGIASTGCDSTATISVIVNPLPVVTSTGFAVCLGQTVNLNATGAGTGATYNWTTPGTPSGPNVSFTPTAAGTFTYTVTGTNSNGCVDQDTVIITVRALPVINAGTDQAVCIGQAVTLNATGAGVGGTYNWNTPGNPTGASVTFTPTAVGTFTFTVAGAATTGCDSTDQVVVTVNPLPVALAGADTAICEGSTVTLGGNQSGATYSWMASQGPQPASVANPSVTLPVAGTYQYIVTATNSNNCVNTDTVTITVNPTPITTPITGFAAVCPGLQNVPYSVVAGPAGSNYVWTVTGGTIATGQGTSAIEVNWGAIGNGLVSVYTESGAGCRSVTVTFPVSINPTLPTPAPNGSTSLCSNAATAAYAVYPQSPPGSVFNWTVLDGSGNSIPFTGGNTNNISVAWPGPGTYSLQVTENSTTNLAFCQGSSTTVSVTVNPSPDSTLAIQGSTNPCVTATNLTYSVAGLPNSTYVWTLDGTQVTSSTGSQVVFPTLPLGTHTLTALETSDAGCVGKLITIPINVTALPITPVVNGPAALCENSFTNLIYSVPANAGSTYAWTLPAGATVSGPSDQSTINISFASFPTTAQTISVIETNATGCTSLAGTFQINPDVVAAQLQGVGTKESDESVVVADVVLPNLGTSANTPVDLYRSTFGSSAAPVVVATLPAGANLHFEDTNQVNTKTESYLYQVKALNACGDTIFSTIHQTILLNQSTESAKGLTTLTWNPYASWTNGVKGYEIYRKADAGNFELVETTTNTTVTLNTGDAGFNQCFRIKAISNDTPELVSWSNSQCTSFENPVTVYNVITPNGDNLNDVFYVDHIELYPENKLVILNRWGQEMHRTTNYHNDWSPKALAEGTYFYQLTLQTGETFTGWVSIVK